MRPILALLLLTLTTSAQATAAEPAPVVVTAQDAGLSELVTNLVRAELPDAYEKKKNWGQTTEVWDGVRVSLDGARIKTKRKKRTVNHGTWTLYRATLTNPQEFAVTIANLRRLDDGRTAFDADFAAPLALFGRISEWQRGVQLFSLSADADARVRLQVTCAVRTRLEVGGKLVPDVSLEPEVTSAKIVLEAFRLHRLSQVHGPLAKELGEELHDMLQHEIDDRNAQIVGKLNQQIARQKDKGKLRLSLSDLASSKFGDLREWMSK